MTEYFTQRMILAVKERDRGSWYNDHQLCCRVVGSTRSLRPGEIAIHVKLKVPKDLIRGTHAVDIIIDPESVAELTNDHTR